jgi:putative transposase
MDSRNPENQGTRPVAAAKASLATYFAFYNARRPHTSLARRTPDQLYFQALPLPKAA